MDFEGLETLRVEYITKTFEAMAKIMENDKVTPAEKIAAGKLIDSISDTIVKARLMTEVHQEHADMPNQVSKLIDQAKKLRDDYDD